MVVSKYQGFTRKELDDKFIYDPINGRFWGKKTGKLLDSTKGGRMYLGVRIADEIIGLQPSRVALILANNYFLKDDETIRFADKDHLNLALDNILVVKKKQKALDAKAFDHPKAHATDVDGVFKIMPMGYFVARRGSDQAVYRSYDFEEVVAIRKEWELDNTIHRWDVTSPWGSNSKAVMPMDFR